MATGNLSSASGRAQPMRLAHLSDPHLSLPRPGSFGPLANKRLLSYVSWRRRRRYRHLPDVLHRVVADLKARNPDQVAVTGDLTHLGLPNEFAEGREWLQQLGAPDRVTVIPGNHERLVDGDWERGLTLWGDYFRGDPVPDSVPEPDPDPDAAFTGAFPNLRRRGGVALISVNSAAATAPLLATGRLGIDQIEGLRRLLDLTAGEFRVVLIHHSPLPLGHSRRKRLTDAPALMAMLQEAGAELVLHGHGHTEALHVVSSRHGDMAIVGAPSASLDGAGAAGWNLYSVTRSRSGWTVDVELRRTASAGRALVGRRLETLLLSRR